MFSLPQYLWRSIVDSRSYPDERQEHAINTEMARCLACVYYFLLAVLFINILHYEVKGGPPNFYQVLLFILLLFIHLYITESPAYQELLMQRDMMIATERYLSRLGFYSATYTLMLIVTLTALNLIGYYLRGENTLSGILIKNIIVGGTMGLYLHHKKKKQLLQILERKQAEKGEAPAG